MTNTWNGDGAYDTCRWWRGKKSGPSDLRRRSTAKDTSEGDRVVGQGYGYLGLNPAHLRGAMTVGWRAPDRMVDMHITPGQMSHDNAQWGGGFEIVTEPRVGR